MFTGIITDIGRVLIIDSLAVGYRLKISTNYDTNDISIGSSIACSGACLTVVELGKGWFTADVSGETLECTCLNTWQIGTPINLERSLRLKDELGGHIVLGHVDGVGKVEFLKLEGNNHRLTISMPQQLSKYIATKGSVTIDGVSLTINEVTENSFGVNIIPHTWENTSFGFYEIGQILNLEIDVVARYVARLMERS